MFVSPICTGTVLVVKEVPAAAAAAAAMRIKEEKATDKGSSQSRCDTAVPLAKRTLNPLVPSLMTLIALGTVVLLGRERETVCGQEWQRKMDNCPVFGQTTLQQPSFHLRKLTNTLSLVHVRT